MYSVYLVDSTTGGWVELDCEEANFTTIFNVADDADISVRKDTISKQIPFKGSKVNNEAFGTLFHMNRVADASLDNKLFFNYAPLRSVDCLIYEDGVLLLKGSLIVREVDVDQYGNVTYQTVITGSFIDFRNVVANDLMDTLDFSHLKHHYTWDTINHSWDQSLEVYDASITGFTYQPFQKGSGYLYGFIDYGETFKAVDANKDQTNIHLNNFRPGIYVKEYFDAIFTQTTGATGYSYEIRGSQDTLSKFNSLVIPNNQEKLTCTSLNMRTSVTKTTPDVTLGMYETYWTGFMIRAVSLQTGLDADANKNLFNYYGNYFGQTQAVFQMNRTFSTYGFCHVKFDYLNNISAAPITVNIQLVAREFVASNASNFTDDASWQTVSYSSIIVPPNTILPATVVDFFVADHTYNVNSQFMLRMYCECQLFLPPVFGYQILRYSVSEAEIRMPKDTSTPLTYYVQEGDLVTPNPVLGVKKIDFLKGIIQLFNFYVYTEKDNPKHLIFERFDDFYALTQPELLMSNALDWTSKIDYSKSMKIKSNVDLPKTYEFTLKDDNDYFNSEYKKNFSEVYGSFSFNDSYGTSDVSKIESIFSPSPLISALGTGRLYPSIIQVTTSGAVSTKKPVKSNIRFLYHNGVKTCKAYSVSKDALVNNADATASLATSVTRYPQVGNYILADGPSNLTPVEDLYWGAPQEYFFDSKPGYQDVPTAYDVNYMGRVSILTDPNLSSIECEAYLSEIDIANLDLRTPVFIDLGELGYAYFRVTYIEYTNNKTTSKVTLQKIVF